MTCQSEATCQPQTDTNYADIIMNSLNIACSRYDMAVKI